MDMFECDICYEQLKDPRVVPCGHTFCKSCLEALKPPSNLKCPKCRTDFTSVETLPPNWVVRSWMSQNHNTVNATDMSASSNNKKPDCGNCEAGKLATFWCENCEHYLCDDCDNSVHNTRVAKSHRRITTQEKLKKPIFQQCAKHHKDNEYFCDDCKVFLCHMCVIDDHKMHNTTSAYKYAERSRDELKNALIPLRNLSLSDSTEKQLKQERATKEKEIEQLEELIKTKKQEIITIDDKFAKHLEKQNELKTTQLALSKSLEELTLQELLNVENVEILKKRIQEVMNNYASLSASTPTTSTTTTTNFPYNTPPTATTTATTTVTAGNTTPNTNLSMSVGKMALFSLRSLASPTEIGKCAQTQGRLLVDITTGEKYLLTGHAGTKFAKFQPSSGFLGSSVNLFNSTVGNTPDLQLGGGIGMCIYNDFCYFALHGTHTFVKYSLKNRAIAKFVEIPEVNGICAYSWGGYSGVVFHVDECGLWLTSFPSAFMVEVRKINPENLNTEKTWKFQHTNSVHQQLGGCFMISGILYMISNFNANAEIFAFFNTHTSSYSNVKMTFPGRGYHSSSTYVPAEKALYTVDNGSVLKYDLTVTPLIL